MREYRGMDAKGEWHCGWHKEEIDGSHWIREKVSPNHYADFQVIPKTVGQSTTLTDKHGKEIFEGDLVKTFDNEIGEIRYDKSFGSYGLQNKKRFRGIENVFIAFDNMCTVGDLFEIIGNIHEGNNER